MQISRHWRLNAARYRLEGVRYETGEVSLQNRPVRHETTEVDTQETARVEIAEAGQRRVIAQVA